MAVAGERWLSAQEQEELHDPESDALAKLQATLMYERKSTIYSVAYLNVKHL